MIEPTDEQLLVRYHESKDPGLQEQLVRRYMPLVERLAARYRGRAVEQEDLEQVGALALVKALRRFEPGRGTAFEAFLVPTVLGELKRHFRDHSWAVRVPRDLQERTAKVLAATERLSAANGRVPSAGEISEATGWSLEEVLEALESSRAYSARSLDERPPSSDGEGPAIIDTIGGDDAGYDLVEFGASVASTIDDLPEREREILRLRFVEDLTQSQIADRVGISQMHVSRLLRRSVDALRHAVSDPSEPDAAREAAGDG